MRVRTVQKGCSVGLGVRAGSCVHACNTSSFVLRPSVRTSEPSFSNEKGSQARDRQERRLVPRACRRPISHLARSPLPIPRFTSTSDGLTRAAAANTGARTFAEGARKAPAGRARAGGALVEPRDSEEGEGSRRGREARDAQLSRWGWRRDGCARQGRRCALESSAREGGDPGAGVVMPRGLLTASDARSERVDGPAAELDADPARVHAPLERRGPPAARRATASRDAVDLDRTLTSACAPTDRPAPGHRSTAIPTTRPRRLVLPLAPRRAIRGALPNSTNSCAR